jgi:predicted RNA methylase
MPYDFYPTPVKTIQTFFNNYPLFYKARILEPCAGNGNFCYEIKKRYPSYIVANEIREEEYPNLIDCADEVYHEDFLSLEIEDKFDYIITNPPFSLAQEIIERCFEIATENTTIIMLLRLSFLESKKRYEFWQKHPLQGLYILSERPSFTGKGTDACAYAFFIWDNNCRQEIKIM